MKASTVLAGIPAHVQLEHFTNGVKLSHGQVENSSTNVGMGGAPVNGLVSNHSSAPVHTPQRIANPAGQGQGNVGTNGSRYSEDEESVGLWKSVASPVPPTAGAASGPVIVVDGVKMVRVQVTVNIGAHGMGIVVSDSDPKNMVVANYRTMPAGVENPSAVAGIQIGDRVEQVNGKPAASREAAYAMLKGLKGQVTLVVLRKLP